MITLDYSHGKPPLCPDLVSFSTYVYAAGYQKPNYPMPALRHTVELIHFNGWVHFTVMYRLPNNYMRPIGDSPQRPLVF